MDDNTSKKDNENVAMLVILKHWHVVLCIVGIIYSWAHFQGSVQNLQSDVDKLQLQANVMDANYSDVSGNIKEINAKLDILLKNVKVDISN